MTGDTPTTPSTWPQEAQSDLAGITRDHEFLRVLASAVKAKGVGGPTTDVALLNSVMPDLTVDSGLSLTDLLSLAEPQDQEVVDSSATLVPVVTGAGVTPATPLTSPTTARSGGTTTTTTADFAPPTSDDPGLTTYDPRACAAGQKANTGNW